MVAAYHSLRFSARASGFSRRFRHICRSQCADECRDAVHAISADYHYLLFCQGAYVHFRLADIAYGICRYRQVKGRRRAAAAAADGVAVAATPRYSRRRGGDEGVSGLH